MSNAELAREPGPLTRRALDHLAALGMTDAEVEELLLEVIRRRLTRAKPLSEPALLHMMATVRANPGASAVRLIALAKARKQTGLAALKDLVETRNVERRGPRARPGYYPAIEPPRPGEPEALLIHRRRAQK